MEKVELQIEYKHFFVQVKEQIRSSQTKAALSVNALLIHLYWTIGKMIAEKQRQYAWGAGVIDQLAKDLKKKSFRKLLAFRDLTYSLSGSFIFFILPKKSYSLLDYFQTLQFQKKSSNLLDNLMALSWIVISPLCNKLFRLFPGDTIF